MRPWTPVLIALALAPQADAGPWDWEDLPAAKPIPVNEKQTQVEPIGQQYWSGEYRPGVKVRAWILQHSETEFGDKKTHDYEIYVEFKNVSSIPIKLQSDYVTGYYRDNQREDCIGETQGAKASQQFNTWHVIRPGDTRGITHVARHMGMHCDNGPEKPSVYRLEYGAYGDDRAAQWASIKQQARQLQAQGDYDQALVVLYEGSGDANVDRDPDGEQLFDQLKSQREQKLAADAAAAQKKQQVATLLQKADDAERRRAWLDCRGYLEEAHRLEPSGEIQSRIARVDQAIEDEEQAKAQAAAAADLEKKQNAAINKVKSALAAKDVDGAKSALSEAKSLEADAGTVAQLQGQISELENQLAAVAAQEAAQQEAQQEQQDEQQQEAEQEQTQTQQAAATQGPAGSDESWKVTANEGVAAMRSGDYDTAIAKFEQAQAEGGGSDPQLARALETARGAKAHQSQMAEVEQQNIAARQAWEQQQEEARQEAERRQAAQVAAAEQRVAEAQARAERQMELVDMTADFLSRRIEAYAANAELRQMAREASSLDLSLGDPRALLQDYRNKVATLKRVAEQKHQEFEKAMEELIELTKELLAEAEAQAQAAGAIAAGIAQAGGHIAIEKQREAKENKLRQELHQAFDNAKNDLIQSNQSGLDKYVAVEAKALSWEAQKWAGDVSGFYQCNINYIHNNYSYDHTAWAEGSCDEPRGAPSASPVSGSRARVALGRYKLERARLGGPYAQDWLNSAQLLADGAVQADRTSDEAWALKAELASDWIDRLAWYQRARDLSGGSAWGTEVEATVAPFSQAFFAALEQGDTAFLDRASLAGVHWLAKSPDGRPPIVVALERNNPETVKTTFRIFEMSVEDNGGPLLHLAAARNVDGSARALIELGVDPHVTDDDGRTPYYVAVAASAAATSGVFAEHDPDHLALMLTAQGLDEDLAADRLGQIGVENAIAADDTVPADALLRARPALLQIPRTADDSYPSWAARDGATRWLTLFLDRGARVDATDPTGVPLVQLALAGGHVETVDRLLERNADVNLASAATGERALHHAVDQGPELVEKVLAAGALVDLPDGRGRNAVHRAVDRGAEPVVARLLEERPNLTLQDADGATPLHLALGGGHAAVADLLLPDSYDVDAQDARGRTPLHLAIAGGLASQRDALLDRGVRLDLQDEGGEAPLHLALRAEDQALVERLLALGAPQDMANEAGERPIHLASRTGDLSTLQTLLDNGETIHVATQAGRHPLHYAAEGGADEVALHLLALGADPKAKDSKNWNAIKVAKKAGFKETAKTIKKYKAPKEDK